MFIENRIFKFLHSSGVLCVLKPHTAPTERGAVLDSCYKHIAPTEQGVCSGFQPR